MQRQRRNVKIWKCWGRLPPLPSGSSVLKTTGGSRIWAWGWLNFKKFHQIRKTHRIWLPCTLLNGLRQICRCKSLLYFPLQWKIRQISSISGNMGGLTPLTHPPLDPLVLETARFHYVRIMCRIQGLVKGAAKLAKWATSGFSGPLRLWWAPQVSDFGEPHGLDEPLRLWWAPRALVGPSFFLGSYGAPSKNLNLPHNVTPSPWWGVILTPLRFFRNSGKTAGRSAAKFCTAA